MAGLTVTVSPSASAFFAGEVFTATVTFRNTATPLPEPPASSSYGDQNGGHFAPHHPPGARSTPGQRTPGKGHTRAASTAAASSYWADSPNGASLPQTPSRAGAGATNATSGGGGGGAGGLHGFASPPNSSYGRTVSSGHAPHPSLSAASASTSHLPTTTSSFGSPSSSRQPSFAAGRSLSRSSSSTGAFSTTTLGSYDPDAAADLPARKGLIGKPPTTTPAEPHLVASSSGGLYSGGPRRPGIGIRGHNSGHARTQSMAVPSSAGTEAPERISGMRSATAPLGDPIRPGAPRRSNSVRGLVAAFEQMDGRQPQSPTGPRGESLLLQETETA